MQKFLAFLLLVALLGLKSPLLFAQQHQNAQQSDSEIESLKEEVAELKRKLQTVENVEKMKLRAELSEANTKLINADYNKFKGELRIDNEERMRAWSYWFFGILGIIAVISGAAVWFSLKSLIASSVEKNLNGFKDAVKAQDAIKNRLGTLEKQYVATVLEGVIDHDLLTEHHPEPIKALQEEVLLQVFDEDKTYYPILIYKAAQVLAARKSPRLISPLLHRLNLAADSEIDVRYFINVPISARLPRWHDAVKFMEYLPAPEAYEGLKGFLNHLLTENPKSKGWFLRETVYSLAQVGIKLHMGDSVLILKKALHDLKSPGPEVLCGLVEYFDIFNEPASIKKILDTYLADESINRTEPEKQLADKCRELLREHYPEL